MDSIIQSLAERRQEMCELVIRWANVNSFSTNVAGLAEVAALVKEPFSRLADVSTEIALPAWKELTDEGQWIERPLGRVLEFRKRPHAPFQILLCGHLDTVYPENSDFQKVTQLNDQILKGPGVTDMKGGLVMMLYALDALERSPHAEKIGWRVLLNPDEELGSPGSSSILEARASEHQLALVFEPALTPQGDLAGERKGSGKFSVIVYGRASHAGRAFNEGRNAVVLMADIVKEIHALNAQHSEVTINVGKIHGGTVINVVPALCVCHLDVRLAKPDDQVWVIEKFHNIVEKFKENHDYRIELHGEFSRPPKVFDAKTKAFFTFVAETAKTLNQSLSWQATGGVCDGNNLAKQGLPVVDSLGVCGEHIHSADEILYVDSLVTRAQLTASILLNLAKGDGNSFL